MFEQAAQRHPDLPLWLSHPLDLRPSLGTRITLRDAAALIAQTAEVFRRAGVAPGDRVAVMKTHRFDVSLLQSAVASVGAVPAMLYPHTDPDIVTTLLERLDRPFLIVDRPVYDGVMAKVDLPALTSGVFTIDDGVMDVERYTPAPPEQPLALPSDVVLIAHSSGTTGVPKLVGYPEMALGAHTRLQADIATAMRMRGPFALAVSYYHGRMVSGLGAAFAQGMPLALLDDTDSDTAVRMFTEVRPQIAESFPNVFVNWERLADHPDRPFSSVRYYVNTFDAIHPRTVQRLLDASGSRMPLYFQAYGTTETGPLTVKVHTRRSIRSADPRCVGYPMPGLTRTRVVSRPGTDDSDHRRGEIEVRSQGASRIYVGEPERVAPGSSKRWWRTGDLGERGRWGCLHLLDRLVDETAEVPSALALEDKLLERVPALSEVIIIPAGNDDSALPVVCTVDDAPLDMRVWQAAVADLPQLRPVLHLQWDQVPRGSTWKVRRLELRRQLAEGLIPLRSAEPLSDEAVSGAGQAGEQA